MGHPQGSVTPVGIAIADDAELQTAWSSTLGGRWLKIAYDVPAGVETGFPGPVIGPYDQYRLSIEKAMDRVLLNGEPVGKVVEETDAEMTAALQVYNEDVGAS